MFSLSHVVHLNVNEFDVLYYKNNHTFIAVFMVVEMLKNTYFQGSYGNFSRTSVYKNKMVTTSPDKKINVHPINL